MFECDASTRHRYKYSDLLSGNFSIPKRNHSTECKFETPSFWCTEDYELGVRFIKPKPLQFFMPAAHGHIT